MAKTLIDGAIKQYRDINFTVYCNSHQTTFKTIFERKFQLHIVREATPFLFKSQPVNLFYKNLRKLILENDVIHHHYPFPTMERALVNNLDLLKQKKLIITWHANIQNSRWSWIESIYNPMTVKLLTAADKIVVTSPQLLADSKILQDYKDKVKIIPLAFDSKFAVNEPKVIRGTGRKILFVGKLRDYKGVDYLIRAMQDVDAVLDIVGNGEKEKKLKQLVADLNLNSKIKFWNNASDEDLNLFYQNASVFVLPSINEAEAFGIVQLEAMGSATPVINTHLKSGVPYVSLDGVTGFTVPPRSPHALATAINRILEDADLYQQFSRNAIARAMEFSEKTMVSKYYEVYR